MDTRNVGAFLRKNILSHHGVSIDTRTLQAGQLFFALRGENQDANAMFCQEALDKGACYVVTTNKKFVGNSRFIIVKDTLKALQSLAIFHRNLCKTKYIGITGSNGKTTTKNLVHAALQKKYITQATQGNYNNHIGVPLTLLSVSPTCQYAVIEMGISAMGEMQLLCDMVRPNYGVITNIGQAHIEGLLHIDNVWNEKKKLYDSVASNEGEIFISTEEPSLQHRNFPYNHIIRYPATDLPIRCLQTTPCVIFQMGDRSPVSTRLIGKHNYYNLITAIAIAKHVGVEEDNIEDAIRDYQPANNRSQWVKTAHNLVLLDAYNANPDSMRVALECFYASPSEKYPAKAVILGDMNELGARAEDAYKSLSRELQRLSFSHILLCGKAIRALESAIPQAHYFPNKKACAAYLREHAIRRKQVLIKGSRSLALEDLIAHL